MLYPQAKQQLVNEIRYAMPTNKIVEVASNVAVRNPHNNEVYFLKNRPHDLSLSTDDFIPYTTKGYQGIDFDAIHGQSLMIEPSILNHRAKAAFEQLATLKEDLS